MFRNWIHTIFWKPLVYSRSGRNLLFPVLPGRVQSIWHKLTHCVQIQMASIEASIWNIKIAQVPNKVAQKVLRIGFFHFFARTRFNTPNWNYSSVILCVFVDINWIDMVFYNRVLNFSWCSLGNLSFFPFNSIEPAKPSTVISKDLMVRESCFSMNW